MYMYMYMYMYMLLLYMLYRYPIGLAEIADAVQYSKSYMYLRIPPVSLSIMILGLQYGFTGIL